MKVNLLLLKDSLKLYKNEIYKYMTSISKKVHIDKLDDIFNKYNNTYHSTIKMKPFDVKLNTYIDSVKKLMIKIRNLKLVIILEYQNIKMFLQKITLQIGQKKFLSLKKLRIVCHVHTLLMMLTVNKLLEHFMKTSCKNQIKKKS